MENTIKTHDIDNKLIYPNYHVRTFSKSPLINVQSNIEINVGDTIIVDGNQRKVAKILTKEPCNKEIFELNNNEGVYVRRVTTYYVIRMDKEIVTRQRHLFYDFVDGSRKVNK